MSRYPSIARGAPADQRGAILFVALILLVVLALIGIAGMQVTTLQERMAGNYYNVGKAFENSEWGVRTTENIIQTTVNANARFVADDETCNSFSADGWAATLNASGGYQTRTQRVDKCTPGQTTTKWGGTSGSTPLSDDLSAIYQVTAVNSDNTVTPANSVSMTVVETIYIP